MELLKIGIGNAKLKNDVAIFDLPAGWTCPKSLDCGDKVDPATGKLIKNENAKFRCFAATSELISKAARNKRWHNYNLIREQKTIDDAASLIIASLKATKHFKTIKKVRLHSSGDFFNEKYFLSWVAVANAMPELIFYTYTKSVRYWVNNIDAIPENLHITASTGGKDDYLIEKFNLKNVIIVYSLEEAAEKGVEIDHDDSHCYDRNCQKFALLIHGTQPKDSDAGKAVQKLRKEGIMGYNRGKVGEGRVLAE